MNFLSTVFAQDTAVNLQPDDVGTAINFTPEAIIVWAVSIIVVVAGLIFFFMLIIGGLKWILSGGDKAQTEAARGQITAALVGLVIIFSAWAITTLVGRIFGFDLFNLVIPAIGA